MTRIQASELKINETAETAIQQIKEKGYINKVKEYSDKILLVGISCDKKSKTHICKRARLEGCWIVTLWLGTPRII